MKRTESSVSITAEMRAFLESGVSLVVGTRDAGCVPEALRAWGPRVSRDRRSISLCVPLATSGRALRNLRDNGRIAATFAHPTNYKTIQLKGRCMGTGRPKREDLAAVKRHRQRFVASTEKIGVSRPLAAGLWQMELLESAAMVKIRFLAEQAFDQTPGPNAGSSL